MLKNLHWQITSRLVENVFLTRDQKVGVYQVKLFVFLIFVDLNPNRQENLFFNFCYFFTHYYRLQVKHSFEVLSYLERGWIIVLENQAFSVRAIS